MKRNVTVIVFANRNYQILKGEYAQGGAGTPGQGASNTLSIDRPALNWTDLAAGHGVPACKVSTLGQFSDAMRRAHAAEGPSLIKLLL
ncbi:thiamine pyrophosphate-dependent enzyme [Variovorax sp. YR216]|uniref:thiamine pyrophosphate-dependent enzyme n=1 Tax=Variovorax sp. YR216 TaxID=1882828 RepID=UPI000ACF82E1|nr:thiamine pyrophosphate-dependent enzyme [Variovorax sp. YR216]